MKNQYKKALYLIRHAKSDWADSSLADIDRPLNQRGYRDAHAMAKELKAKGVMPDIIVTSPAIRAMSTAMIFIEELQFPENQVIINKSLYESSAENLVNQLLTFHEEAKTVFLFGHNPSISQVANLLTEVRIDEVPTCGIVGVGFRENSWKATDSGFLILFDYPKNHHFGV